MLEGLRSPPRGEEAHPRGGPAVSHAHRRQQTAGPSSTLLPTRWSKGKNKTHAGASPGSPPPHLLSPFGQTAAMAPSPAGVRSSCSSGPVEGGRQCSPFPPRQAELGNKVSSYREGLHCWLPLLRPGSADESKRVGGHGVTGLMSCVPPCRARRPPMKVCSRVQLAMQVVRGRQSIPVTNTSWHPVGDVTSGMPGVTELNGGTHQRDVGSGWCGGSPGTSSAECRHWPGAAGMERGGRGRLSGQGRLLGTWPWYEPGPVHGGLPPQLGPSPGLRLARF